MPQPIIHFELHGKNVECKYLGKFRLEKDAKGDPIAYKAGGADKENNFVLGITTRETIDSQELVIRRLPDTMRKSLRWNYFDSKTLAEIWSEPGIYLFVEEGDSVNGVKYVGRASNSVFRRLSSYLAPQAPRETTDSRVNRLLASALASGKHVSLYFYPERDTEKELQKKLNPEWNKE